MSSVRHQGATGQPSSPESQDEVFRDSQQARASKDKTQTQAAHLSSSDSQATDTTGIQRRTLKCQGLFESCQQNSHLSGDDWIDKMSAEFNWWSLGIGAAKRGHSSLDYRVQTRDDVRNTLVHLLESLAISLEKYNDATSQPCNPSQSTIPPTQDEDQEGTAAHDSNPQPSSDDPLIEEQKYYIETTIRFLSRISMAIRKSGTKFRHQRVDKLLATRESELKEFKDYMRYFLLMSPTKVHTLHEVLHRHFLTGDPRWKTVWITLKAYFTDTQRLTLVQNRLIQANLVRRNRYDQYLGQYHRKMPVQEGLWLPHVQAKAVTISPLNEPPIPTPSQSHISRTTPKRGENTPIQPLVDETSHRSSQSATKLGSFDMPQRPREQKARSVSTKLSQGVLKQDYPKCPGAEGESFWCPYCAQLLDSSYSDPKKNKRWRGHLVEDLSPYVCVYEDCDTPDAMYITTAEWKKHIRDRHSRAQWICDPCWLDSDSPEEFEFDSQEEWHKHTLTEHEDEVAESDLPDLAELSQRTVVPPIACPLCCEDTSLRSPETDKHLAEHIHSFALQALPWELIGPDDETKVSMGSEIRNLQNSRHSEQSTTGESQDNDDDEVTAFQDLVSIITTHSGIILRESHYHPTTSISTLLVAIEAHLRGPSVRFHSYDPSFRPEILACLARLSRIMRRHEDQPSDSKEQESVNMWEEDLAQIFKSFQQLESLSGFEYPAPSALPEVQSLDNTGISEVSGRLRSNKTQDPKNQDNYSEDRIRSQIASSHAKLPCFYVRPYQRNPAFTGRDAILAKLRNVLAPGKEPGQQSKMALVGIPGVGKTQIALQYAFESIEDKIFDIVLLGQAETRAKLANSFVHFNEELGLQGNGRSNDQSESREKVKMFLQSTDKPWLLIFDNVDKLGPDLGDFWPMGDKGSVLITTQSQSVLGPLFELSGTINHVSGLDAQDSASLLFKITGLQKNDANEAYTRIIHDRIGGHPLSLTTIASIMFSGRMDLKEYVALFPNVRLFDESKSISTPEAQYSYSLSDAFKTALSRIEGGVGHGNAWSLLELLSFLDPDSVLEQDLRDGSVGSKHSTLAAIADSRKFEENRSLLCKHNVINRNTALRTVSMHHIVRDYCRYKMTTESAQNAFSGAVELLRNLWPVPERHHRYQRSLWPTQERLVNHVVSLANHWKTSQEFWHERCLNADASFAELLYNAGWYFCECEKFPSALPLFQIAEVYCKDNLQNCQIILADVYGAYGGCASECNDAQACFDNFSKQQEHIQKAIKLGFLARPNIREAHAEAGVGVGNMALKRFAEAEQAFRRCLEIWKDCPGNPTTIVSHLGVCLTLQGKLEEAERMLASIIEQRAREFGERDRTSFRTGMIYLAYGNLQIYQNRFDEAYRTHLFSAEMLSKTAGDNHRMHADACYKVGWHQLRRGEFEAAEKTLSHALTIYQASPRFKNEEARVLFKLSEVALKQNKMEDAKTTRDQAEGIRRMIFKNEHIAPGSEEDYDDLIMFWSR